MRSPLPLSAAILCIAALSACGSVPQNSSSQAARGTVTHSDRPVESYAHGAEIASAPTIVVSYDHHHESFPPGAHYERTAEGIVVTYKHLTRVFPTNATIGVGSYHKYAKPSDR